MRTFLFAALISVALTTACADTEPQPVVPGQYIEAAKTDFAGRLQIDVADIVVVDAHPVTWSSGAIGCAESGQVYPPAQVEGHLIVLQHLAVVGNYHQAGTDAPFLCLNPTE